MAVQPRDVIRIWDRHTHPSKPKLHICVWPNQEMVPADQYASRVQAEPSSSEAGNDFLDHDSYVELQQIVEHRESDIEEAVVIGALSDDAVNLLCEAVRSARTLTEDHKELIIRRLRDEIPF